MRDVDGLRLPRRTTGRQNLERRMRSLLVAVGRFGKHRAYSAKDRLWAAAVIDTLSALIKTGGQDDMRGGGVIKACRAHLSNHLRLARA